MTKFDVSKYWSQILNTIHDGLFVVNAQGEIILVNHALTVMTGYNEDEMVGKTCRVLNCDGCRYIRDSANGGHWCALFSQGSLKKHRCILTRKDGTYLPVLKNAAVFSDENGQILGAVETLVDLSEIDKLDNQVFELSRAMTDQSDFLGMIGKSREMQHIYELVRKAGQSNAPVIIYGESGTGKEIAARAIHEVGFRKKGPYIQLNCAALNESLLESELFGHVKGAFTGATDHRRGRFEIANNGDLFLDEIGDIPPSLQVKLLRVLETKQFERVGENRTIETDVRIISATNRDLKELVDRGEFREDLYFRINVIPIYLPPLRDRLEDVPLLVERFIRQLRERDGKDIRGVSPSVMEIFMQYSWPGNVRGLKNALEYAFVTAEHRVIQPENLPAQFFGQPFKEKQKATEIKVMNKEETAKKELLDALHQAEGNQTEAAKILGVSRVTVWNRMRKYNIDLSKVINE